MNKPHAKQMRAPTEEEQALKSWAREELVRDRCRLLECQPFVGKLSMHLRLIPVIDSRLTTACTDGTHLFIDAEFYRRLDGEQRVSILAHEVWHCALRHAHRKGNRDRDRFNYAADVEVDFLLRQDGFKIEMLPYDPEWEGMTCEQIYELMNPDLKRFQKSEKHFYSGDQPDETSGQQSGDAQPREDVDKDSRENPCGGESSERSDGESGGGESSERSDGEGGSGESSERSDGESGGGNGRGNEISLRPSLPMVNHDGVLDPDYRPALSEELEENWKNNLKTAVQQMRRKRGRGIGKGIGYLPGNVAGLVSDDELVATVDWKRVLLDYASQLFGGERKWLPPSRRYVWKKLYLPSRARKTSIEIVLAVDTSGSTTNDLPEFLAELRGMVNAFGEFKLTIIQCDARIHSVTEYSNDDPLPEDGLIFHGFGGTSFLPPFKHVEEKMEQKPTVFIYLTDGFGEAPKNEPDYPVIWCITNGGKKPAPWGLEVQIDSSRNSSRT